MLAAPSVCHRHAVPIKYLEKALDYMCSHEGVWRTTGGEIAEWYYKHFYRIRGSLRDEEKPQGVKGKG